MDFALTEELGEIVVHRPDCPYARFLANAGYPVVTMLDCKRPPPEDMRRHSCLEPQREPSPSSAH